MDPSTCVNSERDDWNPFPIEKLKDYKVISIIYDIPLAGAAVYLIENSLLTQMVQKVILKEMLVHARMKKQACLECIIHSMMDHPKIVKLYEYTETDFGVYLHMEYCNDPQFFEQNIEMTMQPF